MNRKLKTIVVCSLVWAWTVEWVPPTPTDLEQSETRVWGMNINCTRREVKIPDTPAARKHFNVETCLKLAERHCDRALEELLAPKFPSNIKGI
tara:strand:- start:488 stop:766 length:279 start_codon:yes stop_codon:yes gene_type:complete